MAKIIQGRRGIRKAPSIPVNLPPEQRAFFEQIHALVSRSVYHVDGWYQNNVPANQTAVVLNRSPGIFNAWLAPRDGWVWTIWVRSTGARTTGTLTVALFKAVGVNPAAQLGTVTAVLDGTNTFFKAAQATTSETLPILSGDLL